MKGDEDLMKVFLYSKKSKVLIRDEELIVNDGVHVQDLKDLKSGEDIYSIANRESRKVYQEILKKMHFSNLVILSGAGTSVGIGRSNKGFGGFTMAKLWDEINSSGLVSLTKEDGQFGEFCEIVGYGDKYENGEIIKDLEKLLDIAFRKSYADVKISGQIELIKRYIVKACTLDGTGSDVHRIFLRKLTKRKIKDSRVKIFTTNYDTLWEQAAAKDRFTIIDGFTYSYPRYFNGRYFDFDIVLRERSRLKDEDSFVPKLFHLYKIHGSIGWKVKNNEIVQESADLIENEKEVSSIEVGERKLIFPSNNKYESSYEPPYFEMMSRFQNSLRKENTLLITIGFSFLDKHISNVIEETLKQNPSLGLIVVDPSVAPDKQNWKKVFSFADIDNRTLIINETFSDFCNYYPDNDTYDQNDYMEEFANRLTQIISDGR